MKPLAIVGSDAESAADRIAERLGREGRVACVDGDDRSTDGGTLTERGEPSTTVRLGDDGWSARGDELTLDDALDRLATDHDYALAVGFSDVDLPKIVVGTEEPDEDVLVSAPVAEDLDLDAVADALDEVEPRETLESLVARVKQSPQASRSGAIATFTGRVRERDGEDDAPTTHLEFEKYEGVAEERMATIARELEAREGVYRVAMHHRTGVVTNGEDIVFVVVLAGHRPEAFRAVEDGIDRLKEEVPIFKKEVTVEDEFWVHHKK